MSQKEVEITGETYRNSLSSFPVCTVYRDDNILKLMIANRGQGTPIVFLLQDPVKYINEAFPRFPHNLYYTSGNSGPIDGFSQLVAANNMTELILYGGKVNDDLQVPNVIKLFTAINYGFS
jgi:hypothetical protein